MPLWIQIRWSDETVWKNYTPLLEERSVEEQITEVKEKWATSQLTYGHRFDCEFRIAERGAT